MGLATLQRYETGKQQARAATVNRILQAARKRGRRFLDETGECEVGVMLVKDRPR